METIKLLNIVKEYGEDESKECVLNNINLSIKSGELISIMGASGSGKTTLLNILGLMDKQTSGDYYLNSTKIKNINTKEIAKIRGSQIGFIFQSFNLLNDYNLIENVSIPISYSNNKKNMKKRAKDELIKVGLEKYINKKPTQLSGGQKQRVAIARALVNNPNIILADEPTGSLDEKNGSKILDLLIEINKKGKIVIIITHDLKVAKRCDRIINISDGIIKSDTLNIISV